jgi:hypothetical protein
MNEAGDFWSWVGFWVQFAVLGLAGILGAFVASADVAPGDYATGVWLVVACVLLAAIRLKRGLDGTRGGWADFLFLDTMAGLTVVLPLFTVIGIGALFVGHSHGYGSLHDAGIALFVVSALVIFLTMKRAFDRLDRQG